MCKKNKYNKVWMIFVTSLMKKVFKVIISKITNKLEVNNTLFCIRRVKFVSKTTFIAWLL